MQKILLFVFCLSLAGPLKSQFLDPRIVDIGYFDAPTNLPVYADMDGDGYKDLVVAPRSAVGLLNIGGIRWYKNDGTGQFGPVQWADSTALVNSNLQSLDLDGNGSNDLIYEDIVVIWQANDGTGHFSAAVPLNDGNGVSSYQCADLDGDADPDIVEYRFNAGGEKSFYRRTNDGAGNFSLSIPVYLPDSCCISHFDLVDIDGEIYPDLLSLSNTMDSVFWHANDGSGNFGPPIFIQAAAEPVLQVLPRDVDADGDMDLLFFSIYSGQEIFWLTNTGSGVFDPSFKTIYEPLMGGMYSQQIIAEDLTNDGVMDICGVHYADSVFDLLLFVNQNDGQGNFVDYSKPEQHLYGFNPVAADLDNDGLPEVLGLAGNSILQAHNAGGGVLDTLLLQHSQMGTPNGLRIADLNGDGVNDLVYLGSWPDSMLNWRAGDGSGGFGERKAILDINTEFFFVYNYFIVDLDNDGDEDIVATVTENNKAQTYWYKNDGAGNFAQQPVIGTQLSTRDVADLDNDGDLDLFAWLDTEFGWYRNDGNASFSFANYVPVQHLEQVSSDLADLDGDGDLDLITATYDHDFYWYANDGQGTFGTTDHYLCHYPLSLTITTADPDQDNDLDILRGGYSAGWWVNDGLGNFADTVAIDNGYTVTSVVVSVDMDQDGDLDLMAYGAAFYNGSYTPQPIRYYENLGSGNFAPAVAVGDPYNYIEVVPGDLDDDGDLDIAYTDYGTLSWFRNVGDTPYIRGSCFWDQNSNGEWDNGEPPLANVAIYLDPNGQTAYTDSTGAFQFFVSSGDYSLSPAVESCWGLTITTFYQVTVADTVVHGLLFGFTDLINNHQVYPLIGSGFPRCDTIVSFYALLDNESCLETAGKFALTLDTLVTYLSSDPPPVSVVGDTLVWNFDTIAPWAWTQIDLQLKVADANHVGDTIHLQGFTWVKAADGSFTLSDSSLYQAEIRCSFDPNDKLVNRPTVPPFYLPEEQELVYTIRFQNTGNDTAFTVRLLDTLDPGLNWYSLRPLGSSHPYQSDLNVNTGLLQFRFDPIQLPDSATNAATSQGYVQFAIKLQPWLQPGAVVQNRAGIYFDANPAVPTNTAETRVLMPLATHTPASVAALLVEPNPTSESCTLHFPSTAGEGGLVRVLDARGQLLRSLQVARGSLEQRIDLEDLPAGLYWLSWSQPGQGLLAGKVVKL